MNFLSLELFLQQYPNWQMCAGQLHRDYQFVDFVQAFGFMSQVALLAERANHHPDWFNSYNKVSINLMTHETQTVTGKDMALAVAIEQLWFTHYT